MYCQYTCTRTRSVVVILSSDNEYDVNCIIHSLSKLSWRDRKHGRKGIHLTENRNNKRHVILMGMNTHAHYQMPV